MKEELIRKLVEVIDLTKEGAIKGAEVAQKEFPSLCDEICRFGLWKNIMFGGISILVVLITTTSSILIYNRSCWTHDAIMISITLCSIGGIAALISVIVHIHNILKIFLAPKLYIIDYIKEMLTEPRREN